MSLGIYPDELDDLMGKWNEWFDPTEGKTAMQALANQIKTANSRFTTRSPSILSACRTFLQIGGLALRSRVPYSTLNGPEKTVSL
jgi:hypothetical protein